MYMHPTIVLLHSVNMVRPLQYVEMVECTSLGWCTKPFPQFLIAIIARVRYRVANSLILDTSSVTAAEAPPKGPCSPADNWP